MKGKTITKKNNKKRLHYPIQAFVFFFLLLIVALSISAVNIHVYRVLSYSKGKIQNQLEELIGFKISYSNFSPNIINSIKIHEVKVYNKKGVSFTIGDVNISYSLFAFFKNNKKPLSLIKKIRINEINIFLTVDPDEFEETMIQIKKQLNRFMDERGKLYTALLDIDRLIIEVPAVNVTVAADDGSFTVATRSVNSIIEINRNKVALTTTTGVHVVLKNNVSIKTSVQARGNIEVAPEAITTEVDFGLENNTVLDAVLAKQRFHFVSSNLDFSLSRDKDLLPVDLSFDKKGKKYSAHIDIKELQTARLFEKEYKNMFLPSVVTLQTDLEYDDLVGKTSGDVFFYGFIKKLKVLENAEILTNIKIAENDIHIDKLFLYNKQRKGYLAINGDFEAEKKDFSYIIHFKGFPLGNFALDSKQYLFKSNSVTVFKSPEVLVNNNSLGGFHFLSAREKDTHYFRTIKDFNGYFLEGFSKPGAFTLNHKMENFDLSPLIKSAAPDFKRTFLVDTLISLRKNNGKMYINRSPVVVTEKNRPLLSLDVSFFDRVAHFTNFMYKSNRLDTETHMYMDRKPSYIYTFFKNKRVSLEGYTFTEGDKIKVVVNRNMALIINPAEGYVYCNFSDFKIPVEGMDTRINGRFTYYTKTGKINPSRITLDDVALVRGKKGTISADIEYADNVLTIPTLEYKDSVNNITGRSETHIKRGDSIQADGKIFLQDIEKNESISINYLLKNKEINSKIFITHLDINKFTPKRFKGFLNARMQVKGALSDPDIELEGNISDGAIDITPLNALFSIRKTGNLIHINKLVCDVEKSKIIVDKSNIFLDREEGKHKVDFHVKTLLSNIGKVLKTDVDITGYVSSGRDFNLDVMMQKISLGYEKFGVPVAHEKFDDLKFNVSRNEKNFRFFSYGDKFIDVIKIDDDIKGNFYYKKKKALGFNVNIAENKLTGTANFTSFPVGIFNRVLYPYVKLESGNLQGDIVLSGAADDPDFSGKLQLVRGTVRVPDYVAAPIENVTGVVTAKDNTFIVKNVNGSVQKGLIHGFGKIVFNGWKFDNYDFILTSNKLPGIYKTDIIDANGKAEVTRMNFQGQPGEFNFIGEVNVSDAQVTLKNLTTQQAPKKKETPPVNVILTFTAGRSVEVNYPIIRGQIKEKQQFSFQYYGKIPSFHLDGNVEFKKGEINYLNKIFNIEEARFTFYEDDIQINPIVNIKAYHKTRDSANERVQLYLTVEERLLAFDRNTNFYTVPYRSRDEINAMLGYTFAANNTTEENPGNDTFENSSPNSNVQTIANTANYISNSFIFSKFANTVRSATGLDTFILNSSILGNVITNDNNANALDLLDETTVTMGKYVFEGLYLQSLLSFDKQDSLDESIFFRFPNQSYGLNLQFMVQLELPFLSLGYSIIPRDLSNITNVDQQISLETSVKL